MAEVLRGATRIAVVGSPGSGKSTLARAIATATGLPLIHLDQQYWRPGWVEPPDAEWLPRAAALIAAPAWVIDGHYGGTLVQRVARAELVVWLDLPTALCLWRVVKRIAADFGRSRWSSAPDCPERLDPEFLRYVTRFRRDKRPSLIARLTGAQDRIVRLTTRGEVSAFAAALAE